MTLKSLSDVREFYAKVADEYYKPSLSRRNDVHCGRSIADAIRASELPSDVVLVPMGTLKEWHAFWCHYSTANECEQDDMGDERDSVLGAMQAMLAASDGRKNGD